jgi:hypothetical protein
MNQVFETDAFSELYEACDATEKTWIDKMKDQLAEHLHVGKPLRYPWFREKKFGNKRLYYIINESTKKAVLIAVGPKKEQQQIITHILLNKERYQKYVE